MDSCCSSLVWEFPRKLLPPGEEERILLLSSVLIEGLGAEKWLAQTSAVVQILLSPLKSGSILFCSPVFTVKLLAFQKGKGRKQMASRFRYFNCRKCLKCRAVQSRQVCFITRCIMHPCTPSIIQAFLNVQQNLNIAPVRLSYFSSLCFQLSSGIY